MATEYGSKEELGRYLQRQNPKYASIDPLELADKFMAKFPGTVTIKEEPGFLSRAASDIPKTIGEEVSGLIETVKHPIDTAVDLGRMGVGALEMSDPARAIRALATQDPNAQLAQGVVGAIGKDLENAGQRPIRAAVDIVSLVSPKAIGTAAGKANLLAKLGRAGRPAYRAAQTVEGLHRPVGSAGTAVRGVGRQIAKIPDKWSQAAYGEPAKAATGLRDAIVGFTTGTGERTAHPTLEGLKNPVFRAEFQRARDMSGIQASRQGGKAASDVLHEEILRGALKGYDKLADNASMEYNRGIHRTPELNLRMREIEDQGRPIRQILRQNIQGELGELGFRITREKLQVPTPIASGLVTAAGNAIPPVTSAPKLGRWVVREFDPGRNPLSATEKGQVIQQAERFLNISFNRTAKTIHAYRQRLDGIVDGMPRDPQGNFTPAGVAMSRIRNAVHETMKDVIGGMNPEYLETLNRYTQARSKLDLMAKEFGLKHGVIDANEIIHEGKMDRGGIITKIMDTSAETAERRFTRPDLLKELEDAGGSDAAGLTAKVLGTQYAATLASGLVGRGQIAGKIATLAAAPVVGFSAGGGIPGLLAGLAMDIPIAMMYSPRFASTMFILMAKFSTNPNPGKVRRAAASMQGGYRKLMSNTGAAPIIRAGIQEGWSVAKTIQVLQERGVDVEGILNPEQKKATPATAKPTMLKNLSRANPVNLAR